MAINQACRGKIASAWRKEQSSAVASSMTTPSAPILPPPPSRATRQASKPGAQAGWGGGPSWAVVASRHSGHTRPILTPRAAEPSVKHYTLPKKTPARQPHAPIKTLAVATAAAPKPSKVDKLAAGIAAGRRSEAAETLKGPSGLIRSVGAKVRHQTAQMLAAAKLEARLAARADQESVAAGKARPHDAAKTSAGSLSTARGGVTDGQHSQVKQKTRSKASRRADAAAAHGRTIQTKKRLKSRISKAMRTARAAAAAEESMDRDLVVSCSEAALSLAFSPAEGPATAASAREGVSLEAGVHAATGIDGAVPSPHARRCEGAATIVHSGVTADGQRLVDAASAAAISSAVSKSSRKPLPRLPTETISHVKRATSARLGALTEVLLALAQQLDIRPKRDKRKARAKASRQAKKVLVVGLRQVRKAVEAGMVKLLIMSRDLEMVPAAPPSAHTGTGGVLHESVSSLIREAETRHIPIVFPFDQKRLGRALRSNRHTAVAITSFQGLGGCQTHLLEEQAGLPLLEDHASETSDDGSEVV